MTRRTGLLGSALALLLLAAPGRAEEEVLVVRAARLFDGEKVVENAVVVIRGGVVVDEPAREGATVLDAGDGWVTPGLVDPLTSFGITGPSDERTLEVTPRFSVADEFDRSDPRLVRALAEGVTTAYSSPGTANVVAGQGAVLRAGPGGWSVAARDAALEVTVTDDPAAGNFSPRHGVPASIYSRRPNTRMGVIWILRSALFHAAGPDDDPDVAAVRETLTAGKPLRVTARREEDIRAACRVAREFGLSGFVVQDGIEAWRAAEPLRERGASVILAPPVYNERGIGPDSSRIFLAGAAKLAKAEVPFTLTAGRGGDGTGLREAAGLARRFGLSRETALRAITSRAAEMIGAGDTAGRIAPGRVADLVVYSGDPLEPTTAVRAVIVHGKTVIDRGENR